MGLELPVAVRVVPPAVHLALTVVMGDPPVPLGAVNAMLSVPSPAVAAPMVGASGVVTGVAFTPPEELPVPSAFVAVTEHVYKLPFSRPVTTIGLEAPV